MKRVLMIVAVVCTLSFFLIGGTVHAGCVMPPAGLVSWWTGDGHTNDIADSNTGVLKNGASYAPGISGLAFSFDGVDDYVEIGAPGNLDILKSLTLGAWIKRLGDGTGAYPAFSVIVGKAGLSGSAQWDSWFLYYGEGKPEFFVVSSDNNINYLIGPVLPDNVWHYLAGTFDDATRAMKLYVNGVLVAEGTTTAGLPVNLAPVRIGCSSHEFTPVPIYEPFNGLIDEVEIYDHALTATEIQSIYLAGSAGKCKADVSGCIALKGIPLSNTLITLQQKKIRDQITSSDVNGCYEFYNVVSRKDFKVIINGPVVP